MKKEDLKVTSIRYFETRRGLGYKCSTNIKSIEIWNDGNGGGTYLVGYVDTKRLPQPYNEEQLENLIDDYEFQQTASKKLLEKIWGYCKHTHNDQDYKDLQEFSADELKEILNDLKTQ